MAIKVGILSMQRIKNYGSFLQAYGLKHILEDLGCEVQFVDYHSEETLIPAEGGIGIARKFFKVTEVLKQDGPLGGKMKYIQYKKNYAANYYPYLGITEEYNYRPELDVLVIGSDEVFNCVQNNINVGFCPELFGQGNRAKKLISYAASFGDTTLEKLEKYGVKDKVADWLKNFDAISVRDKNSGEIVRTLTKSEPEYNLDPVLIYDFIGKCNDIPADVQEKDYIILYGYAGRFSKEECSKIRKYAEKKRLKIICIGGVQGVCDKFVDCNPFQVIAYFKYAKCVLTDTFHGTILSIIMHRQFASVVRSTGYGNSEKLPDLLSRLRLEDRIIEDLDGVEEIIDRKIDYKQVDNIIEKERNKSYEYLKEKING